ncbi:unnamed protein product [Durusdinium trenchii]|uniref:Secreted protein n=1 Tax=Durusdinium trenchii TaxID=1381693 RepID=A0ABP0N9N0_9DINO
MPRAEFVLVSDFGILLHCFNHHFVCDNYIHVYSVIVQVHVAEGATSGHCYKRSSRRQGLFGFKLLKKIRKCHTNLFNSRLSVLITGLALH